ncbi:hypothetical protein ABT095_34730 [Kitasatospora sp. NPDC002227]|uniref:hypothetical protein n=1 Tax=Kitasatospora sp. NPDC002227 TaxID=3154773 RepID=UPI00331D4F32
MVTRPTRITVVPTALGQADLLSLRRRGPIRLNWTMPGGPMDWDALVGGLVGAAVGAGIPAVAGYHQLRRARQATDAEAFGPALLLLDQIHPDRVSMNVSTDPTVEDAKWVPLAKQAQVARERLLVVRAGHPRRRVRDKAGDAEVKLANAYISSRWQASDMAQHKGSLEYRETALGNHAEAVKAVTDLINANFSRW